MPNIPVLKIKEKPRRLTNWEVVKKLRYIFRVRKNEK